MYRKDNEGWLKHTDFIVLDMIFLQVAFVLAYAVSGYGFNPYATILYRNMALFLELADLIVLVSFGTLKDILKSGYYKDFSTTVQHSIIVGALAILYLFLLQEGQLYSRLALMLTVIIYILITYVVRELWKRHLKKRMVNGDGERSLLIVTTSTVVEQVVDSMKEHNYARYNIAGVAVIDDNWTGRTIRGVKVVANEKTTPQYVCQEWIDEVLVVVPESEPYPTEMMEQLSETGVTIHLNLAKIVQEVGKKQFVERVGEYTVLTTSMNSASSFQLMLKRLIDIVGGLVGCILTGIICIFVGPAIYIASPGPIFFAQERIGKNEFCKDTSNAEQAANLGVFVNNLETTNMLNTGFTIISIAITVWIGLNIYNVVSKEYIQKAIEEYNEEMLILEQKREEKMQFIFKKTVFINLLYMTGKRYYASEFFADLFWNTDKEYEKLDLIIEYEKEYIQCCRFYENSEKLNANRVAEDLIAKYKELGSKEPYTEYADTDPMKNFIRMRLSDVYFYKNMTCDKEQFNLQEMKESVELYETVIDNPSKIEFWDEKVDAYFCNSQGYTLRTMSKHEENEKKKLDYQNSALNKLSVAVSKQPNNGRYNRNLGLVYEDKGDLEKACERYKKAVQIDSFDYKAYNTVVSVELKRLEEEYGIKGRKEKLLNEIDFSNPKDWIEKIDNDILQCQKAEKLMFTFVDTHYNMAKAYMYKYLLEGKVKKELLKAAHNQIDIALELDPKSAGALYTKRNIYEAEGNYAEAKNCAENEVIAGKGDNKYLPSEYDKRMRMKLIAGK